MKKNNVFVLVMLVLALALTIGLVLASCDSGSDSSSSSSSSDSGSNSSDSTYSGTTYGGGGSGGSSSGGSSSGGSSSGGSDSGGSSSGGSSSGGSSSGGTTVEYRIDQPIFGTCSKSGSNLTINWTLKTSGKTPNGLYTYTQPTNIIIGIQNDGSYTDIQTLSASARTFTLNNYATYATGYNNDRVYIRVKCTSSYNETVSYIGYSISANTFTPSY